MRYFLFLYIPSICLFFACKQNISQLSNEERLRQIDTPTLIAFGSCNDEDQNQDYWKSIEALNPQLWIWMGDNIYGDSDDMSILKQKYKLQKQSKTYQKFINKTPVIGTWDDHDYGVNDGNKRYAFKEESKNLMLNFLNVPDTSFVRKHDGVYMSYTIGKYPKNFKVILLDTRSFQDELIPNPTKETRYLPSEEDILGEEQWTWLEQELKSDNSPLTIIISSIQLISKDHKFEKWSNFPRAKERMYNLLSLYGSNKVLFLSGDRHIAEISAENIDGLPYPLYDITSSGLTHSYKKADEYNQHRVGDLFGVKNFGALEIEWIENKAIVNAILYSIKGDVLQKTALEFN